MKARAQAMLKIARVMDTLAEEDQALVAVDLFRAYGPPELPASPAAPSRSPGAARLARFRANQRYTADNGSVTESDVGVTQTVTDSVTERYTEKRSETNLPIVVSSVVALEASEVPATKRQKLRADAVEVLGFLNQKTGRSFREVDGNLTLIMARMASGASVQDCKAVIARQVRAWKDDEKMNKFLRPETLFNRTKFESYLGQREAVMS